MVLGFILTGTVVYIILHCHVIQTSTRIDITASKSVKSAESVFNNIRSGDALVPERIRGINCFIGDEGVSSPSLLSYLSVKSAESVFNNK